MLILAVDVFAVKYARRAPYILSSVSKLLRHSMRVIQFLCTNLSALRAFLGRRSERQDAHAVRSRDGSAGLGNAPRSPLGYKGNHSGDVPVIVRITLSWRDFAGNCRIQLRTTERLNPNFEVR